MPERIHSEEAGGSPMGARAKTSPTRLYEELNRDLFKGRLPRFRVTLCGSKHLPGASPGECLEGRRLIRLRRGLEPEGLRRWLLHEMCHIGVPDHGLRFQTRLLRLADQGESWALEEVKGIREAPSWNHAMANLRGKLDDVAGQVPRPRFTQLLRWLADDFGMPPGKLLQSAPWIRAAWKKAFFEHDRIAAIRRSRFTR